MRKSFLTGVFLCFLIIWACLLTKVSAENIEDKRLERLLVLLVQKGVISQEETGILLEAVAEPQEYSTVSSQDNVIRAQAPIKMGGYIKMQSQWAENGELQNNDSYRIRQARVQFVSAPHPNTSLKLGLSFERSNQNLLDASFPYRFNPESL